MENVDTIPYIELLKQILTALLRGGLSYCAFRDA